MKIGDLVMFGADYPSGHSCGVGMIVGYSKDMPYARDMSRGRRIGRRRQECWRVLFGKRMQNGISTNQLEVISESG